MGTFRAGEFTVKLQMSSLTTEKTDTSIVFENNEGKQYKHNQFVPSFQQDYQENNISSYLVD